MYQFDTVIGEHLVRIIHNGSSPLGTFFKEYTFLNLKDILTPHLTIELQGQYGLPFADFNVDTYQTESSICFKRRDYLIEVSPTFESARIFFYDHFALKHALMNLYSSFIVHNNWGLLIHSSCVIQNNKAHIFAGYSGAGKSTAARLSYPRPLLSDEASIVKITPDNIVAFHSPFRSEIQTNSNLESKPLESINLLNQAMQNYRSPITKSEALFQLIDKVFYWTYSPTENNKVLHLVKELVETVPTYQLYFQKNDTFWEMIS